MEIKTPPQFGIGGRKSNAEWTFCLMRLIKDLFKKKLTFRVAAKTTSSMVFNNFVLSTHTFTSPIRISSNV